MPDDGGSFGDLIDAIVARAERATRPLLIGVGGPVAVGKSTFARELASGASDAGMATSVVTTDGFLFANAVLDARGLSMRKGFPESFDAERFAQFLEEARAGAARVRVPRYSHLTYDITGDEEDVDVADVLVVEGVNVLLPEHVDAFDLTIYLDAPDDAVIEWFTTRISELSRAARDEPASFFRPYAAFDDDQIAAFARGAWDAINAVNLELHIRPQRDHADVIVEKRADHAIQRVVLRQSNENV